MIGLGHYPSIENLQCFVAASEHLNFSRAAHEMAITATAFGQRIRQLEEQLDTALFTRTTRRVTLTEAGVRLLPQARQILDQAESCRTIVHSESDAPMRFTVGTRLELGQSWLVPAVVELSKVHSNWSIDLYFGSGPDILDQLERAKVDALVTSAPVANADWEAEFLHREDYVFCASTDLLRSRPFDSPQDAAHHQLLDVSRQLPLTRYLTSAVPDMEFSAIKICGTGAAVIAFVKAGLGVAVLPKYMVEPELESGEFQALLPDVGLLHDSFRLIFRSASPHAPALRRLAIFLRERPLV